MPNITNRADPPTFSGPSPEDLSPEEHGHGEDYQAKWSQRHAQAESVDKEIRSLAFPSVGEDPGAIETFAGEDPAALGMSVPTGFHPVHMLSAAQTLQKWDVPPLPPSHHEGFGSSVAANKATINPDTGKPRLANTDHIGRHLDKLSERMGGVADPLGNIVNNRVQSIRASLASGDPDAAWYQGKAQALIHHAAGEAGVEPPVMRKTTAAVSPRLKWDLTYKNTPSNRKEGRAGQTVFPNIEAAGSIIEASRGRTPDEAAEEVVTRGIQGVQRQMAARVASGMLTGNLRGSSPMPQSGESEKVQSFDVNLSDPTHPVYGHSAWVERHQLSGHTADVQDARAGGFHEESLEVPRAPRLDKETGKQLLDKKGKPLFVGKPFHEEFLSHPAGADIAQSTALVARTEEFKRQHAMNGDQWARENAKNFMPGPSQSMQWSIARDTGTVEIPEHILAAYATRPKPTGFGGYHGPGTKMTKRDWSEV